MNRSGRPHRHWLIWAVAPILIWQLAGCDKKTPPTSETPPSETPLSESGVVIGLVQGQDPIPKSRKIWRSQREDHVRWENQTSVARTITFQPGIWPFQEAQVVITVPANGKSDWYTIGSLLQMRQYVYHVDPPVNPSGPPGEPDISGGD